MKIFGHLYVPRLTSPVELTLVLESRPERKKIARAPQKSVFVVFFPAVLCEWSVLCWPELGELLLLLTEKIRSSDAAVELTSPKRARARFVYEFQISPPNLSVTLSDD